MRWWQQVKSQKSAPSPQSSTNLQEKQIRMSGLDTAQSQFSNTTKEKFQDKWTQTQWIWYTQVNNQQNKAWTDSLRDILDQEKQLIETKKIEHPTGTLVTTFNKPVGEANMYVRFW